MEVVVQMAAGDTSGVEIPSQSDFERWASVAVAGDERGEVCVRIVANRESADLNQRYRGCADPTNVLAFPYAEIPVEMPAEMPAEMPEPQPLGDIVIAAPVVAAEANEQGKPLMGHWAHLFVHGLLHLQGYDHANEKDALRMETKETEILSSLGFDNPYRAAPRAATSR